jgi:hypothetical protein
LAVKLTQHKPSVWGGMLPFYLGLGAGYLVLVAGLGWGLTRFLIES